MNLPVRLEDCRAVKISPLGQCGGSIRPPGSKSLTNRALVCAALGQGVSQLTGVLDSEDTQVMVQAWQNLGLDVEGELEHGNLTVHGCGGDLKTKRANVFVANSGTTIRFLTAALAACHGQFTLDGIQRMRERPIGDLLRALEQLGAKLASTNPVNSECPPVLIDAVGLQGGVARVAGSISSQYLSGLMMACPLARGDVRLEVTGTLVSVPYVEMTRRVMESFGAKVEGEPTGPIKISASHRYRATVYQIEPDASAASYFWAAAAITGGSITVEGLGRDSLQGDVRFCEVLHRMGCHVEYSDDSITVGGPAQQGVTVDMADISDTVQSLAAVALFVQGPTTITGVAHNRHKETDRIADLATELRKLGATVTESADGLMILPPPVVRPGELASYNDHRMAMSLALVGLRVPGVVIRNPRCTAKTYPGYWTDLARVAQCQIEPVA